MFQVVRQYDTQHDTAGRPPGNNERLLVISSGYSCPMHMILLLSEWYRVRGLIDAETSRVWVWALIREEVIMFGDTQWYTMHIVHCTLYRYSVNGTHWYTVIHSETSRVWVWALIREEVIMFGEWPKASEIIVNRLEGVSVYVYRSDHYNLRWI